MRKEERITAKGWEEEEGEGPVLQVVLVLSPPPILVVCVSVPPLLVVFVSALLVLLALFVFSTAQLLVHAEFVLVAVVLRLVSV